MRVLVTGGTGFIGSRLVKKLDKAGHDVISIDRALNSVNFQEYNYVLADLCNQSDLTRLRYKLDGIDVVYHLAGKKNLQESFDRVLYYHNSNVVGSLNLLSLCEDAGVKRFVFASSAAVYSEPDVNLPIVTEDLSPTDPASPYGLQKQIGRAHV